MNRAEKRQAARKEEKKKATYNLTMEQMEIMVNHARNEAYEEAFNTASNLAIILCLAIPMKVLMDHYISGEDYKEQLNEFMTYVLEYYEMWQNDEIDIEELREELWENAGIRLEQEEE